MCVCACVCVQASIHKCMLLCMHPYINTCIFLICVFLHVFVCLCVSLCACAWVFTYNCTHRETELFQQVFITVIVSTSACLLGSSRIRQPICWLRVCMIAEDTKLSGLGSIPSKMLTPNPCSCMERRLTLVIMIEYKNIMTGKQHRLQLLQH